MAGRLNSNCYIVFMKRLKTLLVVPRSLNLFKLLGVTFMNLMFSHARNGAIMVKVLIIICVGSVFKSWAQIFHQTLRAASTWM